MKKVLLFGAFMAILGVSAHAVQKCVALDVAQDGVGSDYNGSEWSAEFDNGVTVKGIGVCSFINNYSQGDSASYVHIGPSNSGTTACWCRMIEPAVSRWVFYWDYEDELVCADQCSYICGDAVAFASGFRSAVFSAIGN